MMKVADAIARTLHAYGVRYAFGIPGNDVLETIRACEEAGIEFVLAKSEPAAAFMADAVYQLTGCPTVLIPALGPGLANAISGIAGALMERSAVLVLGGEMASAQQAIYTHQVFDHVAAAAPVTKWATQLNPARAAQQVAKALDIAMAHPAGPVLVNMPADGARAESADAGAALPPRIAPSGLAADTAVALRGMIAAAEHPLALIGLGALIGDAPKAARDFVSSWKIPAFTTYKAKGVIDEHHPLALGAVGLSPVIDGETLALLRDADFLVLIGFDPIELRDAWLDAWPADRACLALDWSAPTHRAFPLGHQAVGTLPLLLEQLRHREESTAGRWSAARLAALRQRIDHIVRPRAPARGISPAALLAEVSRQAAPDWLMTVDVGAHRILANHVVKCRGPGQLMQSNGLCCMGYAVPAAIGAQLVHPERTVVALVGDGCMLMTQGELALAAERNLPIVVVVLNDGALSLIKLKQAKMQMAPRAVDFASPRFDIIGQGFGAVARRVETLEEFTTTLREAVGNRRFTVIDAVIDPTEYMEEM
ncbi:MAG: thiamine pyrophosphate-binding protein [Alphaproteobacteria bacterium]|nr:thiamine pyrophosphate-binding protein [Alphaproteobacteria bacterium]